MRTIFAQHQAQWQAMEAKRARDAALAAQARRPLKVPSMDFRHQLALAAGTGTVARAVLVITHFESQQPLAYLDPPGIPTICYGHKVIQAARAVNDRR